MDFNLPEIKFSVACASTRLIKIVCKLINLADDRLFLDQTMYSAVAVQKMYQFPSFAPS
jgi:hypothetical protein